MHGFISRCVCLFVCSMLLLPSPWCHVSLSPLCVHMCVSQPPVEGRPPLPIRDVHRDWQFGRHDLRGQHQGPELLRGGGTELGRRRRRWWLRLRRRRQPGRRKHWYQASLEDCWRDVHMAPMDNDPWLCQETTTWRNCCCCCCCVEKQAHCPRTGGKKEESSVWKFLNKKIERFRWGSKVWNRIKKYL